MWYHFCCITFGNCCFVGVYTRHVFLIHISIAWYLYVVLVWSAGCLSSVQPICQVKTLILNVLQPNSYVRAMVISTTNFYQSIPLSVTLTSAWDEKVSTMQETIGSFFFFFFSCLFGAHLSTEFGTAMKQFNHNIPRLLVNEIY